MVIVGIILWLFMMNFITWMFPYQSCFKLKMQNTNQRKPPHLPLIVFRHPSTLLGMAGSCRRRKKDSPWYSAKVATPSINKGLLRVAQRRPGYGKWLHPDPASGKGKRRDVSSKIHFSCHTQWASPILKKRLWRVTDLEIISLIRNHAGLQTFLQGISNCQFRPAPPTP